MTENCLLMPIRKVRDLDIYNLSFDLAMDIYRLTLKFPKEEKYSLTDQIRRSSRSIAGNIAEGFGKRHYVANFKRHLIDAMGSLEETKSWLEFSEACEYINSEVFDSLYKRYEDLGAKIYKLHETWT